MKVCQHSGEHLILVRGQHMFGIEDWTVLAVTTESTGALPDGLHFGLLCFGTAGPNKELGF